MNLKGTVRAVCVSAARGTAKRPVERALLIKAYGIEGDAHAGSWHRQVSLLSCERVEDFNRRTQIGKDCHSHCAIHRRVGDCIMPREGVFAEVLEGGEVRAGDGVDAALPDPDRPFTAAVITLSDKGAAGERADGSGPAARAMLEAAGYQIVETLLLPDDEAQLKAALCRLADQRQVDLIVTSGGTGFSLRDRTPEATLAVADRNAPGVAEYIRVRSMEITPRAMLGRGVSVIRKGTLIVNLPGSPKAVRESLGFILGPLEHGLGILRGSAAECAR